MRKTPPGRASTAKPATITKPATTKPAAAKPAVPRTAAAKPAAAKPAAPKTTASPDPSAADPRRTVERIQTGVRMERRILGVLKALADLHGLSLGDLLEGIVLHAFEGSAPFSAESLAKIRSLKQVFGLDLDASDSHLLVERPARAPRRSPSARR